MQLKLLRDRRIVEDEWTRWSGAQGKGECPAHLILPFDQWLAEKPRWQGANVRLGVLLLPTHRVELLASDLARFELIAAEFCSPSEGRGYTQGRLLRERYGFTGELRAVGYVRRDQLFFWRAADSIALNCRRMILLKPTPRLQRFQQNTNLPTMQVLRTDCRAPISG